MLKVMTKLISIKYNYAKLFGYSGSRVSLKVHQLSHITNCVRNWGPLWTHSCFPFESINGRLKEHFYGTKKNEPTGKMSNNTMFVYFVFLYLLQLAFSYTLMQLIPSLCPDRDTANSALFDQQRFAFFDNNY